MLFRSGLATQRRVHEGPAVAGGEHHIADAGPGRRGRSPGPEPPAVDELGPGEHPGPLPHLLTGRGEEVGGAPGTRVQVPEATVAGLDRREAGNRREVHPALGPDLGLPVVVKPQDGNQGKGVTVNIVSRDHLEIAFRAASEFSSNVMVERFIPGHDHRLLVVGDRLIAAARRDPPHEIGRAHV